MAHAILQPLRSLLVNGTHRFATCWKIERTDGVTMRFTDHDSSLTVDGEVYTPAGSFSASARQRREGTQPQNLELLGFIDSASITEADLRAGRYRNAKVTEFTVNWQYPWAGKYGTNIYYVQETTFDSEQWTARLEGLSMRLKPKVGSLLERTCGHALGDDFCQVNLASFTTTGSVGVVNSRHSFTTTLAGGARPDDYYNDGLLTWTSGANDGLEFEIQSYTAGVVVLHVDTPFDVVNADTFTIKPGCMKRFTEDCINKFDNGVNFGGFPDIPTNDDLFRTPDARRT